MNRLPQQLPVDQLQSKWAAVLNPVIACPLINGLLLENVALEIGANVVNHRLGRKLTGWIIVRQNAAANIYDMQEFNQMPQLTLNLTTDADTTVSMWVF